MTSSIYTGRPATYVIAITDHILMRRDLLARAGRLLSLGQRDFSVTEARFTEYLDQIAAEALRAHERYGMLVVPGAEITQNHIRSQRNSHIVALNIRDYISAPVGRRDSARHSRPGSAQRRVPPSSPHDPARRDRHVLSVGPAQASRRPGGCMGGGES